MSIVATRCGEFRVSQCLVPLFQTFGRSLEIQSKKQLRVSPLRPEDVEERDDWINLSCICKDVINLDAIHTSSLPVLELFRIRDYGNIARQSEHAIAILRPYLISVDEEHSTMQ